MEGNKSTKMLSISLLFLLLISGILAQDVGIKYGPMDTSGVDQHDLVLYCQVEDPQGDNGVYWHCSSATTDQDITIGPNVNTNSALDRYTIDNSGASFGQFNLIISNVTFLDSGRCSCILQDGSGNIFEAGADVTVGDTPTPPAAEPTCEIDKIQTPGQSRRVFTAEDDIMLECESQGGVPLADIHWEIVRDGSEKGVRIGSSYTVTENSITATATYHFTSADDGAYFQCVQTHRSLPDKSRTCSPVFASSNGRQQLGRIMVKYRPNLRFVPPRIMVGSSGTTQESLRCEFDANPSDLDSGPIITADEGINMNYTFDGRKDSVDLVLDKNDIDKIILCNATNELGESFIELVIEKENESDILLPVWLTAAITGSIGLTLFILCAICLCFCLKEEEDTMRPRRVHRDPFERDEDRGDMRVYDSPPDDGYGNDPGAENYYGERSQYMNYRENEMLSMDNIDYFDHVDEKGGNFETEDYEDENRF